MDYLTLTPGMFGGDQINIANPDFRECALLTIIGDTLAEDDETVELRLVSDNINGLVTANFIYEPNVTRVIIQDDDTTTPSVTPMPSPSPSPSPSPTDPPTAIVASPSPCKSCHVIASYRIIITSL